VSTAVAVVLLLAIVAYAVFGGADFGVGFWDLTAGGSERGKIRGMSSSVPSVRCGKPLIAVPGFVLLFVLDQKVCFRRKEWMMNRSLIARPPNKPFLDADPPPVVREGRIAQISRSSNLWRLKG